MARKRIGNEWVVDPTEAVAVAPKKAKKKVKKSGEEQQSESD